MLPEGLPPGAGLVLCMAQVVIQLHMHLLPVFVCSQHEISDQQPIVLLTDGILP